MDKKAFLYSLLSFCIMAVSFWGCGGKKVLTGEFTTEGVQLKFAAGQVHKYKWTANVKFTHRGGIVSTGVNAPAFIAASMKVWETKVFRTDASTTQEITFTNNKETAVSVDLQSYFVSSMRGGRLEPDREASELEGRRVKIVFDRNGNLKDWMGFEGIPYTKVQVANMNEILLLNYALIMQSFPEKRLKIGDTWRREYSVPLETKYGDAVLNMGVDYTLTGFEMKSGYKCAVIETKISSQIEKGNRVISDFLISGSGQGEGEIYFAFEEGLVVSQKDKIKTEFRITGSKEIETKGESTIYIDFERDLKLSG